MHPTQKQLLELISRRNIGSLSLREISSLIPGKNSAQNIKHHLSQLAKRGLIKIDKSKKSVTRIQSGVKTESNLIPIPILGSANCGEAMLFANETPSGHLNVSPTILGDELMKKAKNLFALLAVGPSMNRANIRGESVDEGDYVIVVENRDLPNNGDYVASIIDGCATIKRFYKDDANQRIILVSESTESIPPLYIHQKDLQDYLINGTVVLVMKTPNELQEFLDTGASDVDRMLGPEPKEDYKYYMSLPDKR